MKAEYNHWYKCQEGTMPEDFENCINIFVPDETCHVVVQTVYGNIDASWRERYSAWKWRTVLPCVAWMLPEPYKEQKDEREKEVQARPLGC